MSEDQTIDEASVVAYLSAHPEFLADHPQLMETLEIPHPAGEAASLIEYQVSVLKDKNRALSRKVRDYHQRAEENEALLRKVYDVCLEIVDSDSVASLLETLTGRLKRDFGCEHVRLALFSPRSLEGVETLEGEAAAEAFEEFREEHRAACGRISRRRLALMFSEEEMAGIESGALITVGQPGYGLLALGSGDEHKFYPGMGTLFLELLGQMLGQRLRALGGDDGAAAAD